jgi:HlyD family secretion protein
MLVLPIMFTHVLERQQEIIEELGLPSRRSPWRSWLILIGVVLLGVVGSGVRALNPGSGIDQQRYRLESLTRGSMRVTIGASGRLRGRNTVDVGAEVSGRVISVAAKFNDHVRTGQLLAVIDPSESHAELDEASARVAEAKAHVEVATAISTEANRVAARASGQASKDAISAEELDRKLFARARAAAELSAAQARADVALATRKSASTRRARTRILSPIEGIVLSRSIDPGQVISAGLSTPRLFRIAEDLRKMSLSVYIDESDVGLVKEGQEATFSVDTYPRRVFTSRVQSLRNEPREGGDVVTYEAILEVENEDLALRPGMTANAAIVVDERLNVLTAPNAALRFSPAFEEGKHRNTGLVGPRVWTTTDGALRAVSIETGATDGERTEILSTSLHAGSEVIVDMMDPP